MRPLSMQPSLFVQCGLRRANSKANPCQSQFFCFTRESEYGLQFYSNQVLRRYELLQIPDEEHIVVAQEGIQAKMVRRTVGRRFIYLWELRGQHLDYYWVGAK